MTTEAQEVFWKILNCPFCNTTPQECGAIINQQNDSLQRMVPEPWSGNIQIASMLVIGVIPSLPKDEVFPTRSSLAPYGWGQRCAQSGVWTNSAVESFFENRFCGGACPTCGQRYYDVEMKSTLHHFDSGCVSIPAQNDYWGVYDRYCSAIADDWHNRGLAPLNFRASYVFTDVVHCKGKKEKGVKEALRVCGSYLQEIVSLFVKNAAPYHAILIIGKNNWSQYVSGALDLNLVTDDEVVGTYELNRSGLRRPYSVFRTNRDLANRPVEIYYNIPAPSRANNACRPVTFLGHVIGW